MNLHKEIYVPKPSPHDPDNNGHFGSMENGQVGYGGRFVPETLMPALEQLRLDYEAVRFDKDFWSEVDHYYKNYVGRPSALYFAENLSKELDAKITVVISEREKSGALERARRQN